MTYSLDPYDAGQIPDNATDEKLKAETYITRAEQAEAKVEMYRAVLEKISKYTGPSKWDIDAAEEIISIARQAIASDEAQNKNAECLTSSHASILVSGSLHVGKMILDACCGGRQFWFNKSNPNVLFVDQRIMPPTVVGGGKDARVRKCLPDIIMDFRKLELPDNYFSLVVFDPPHLFLGENSYMAQSYGALNKQTWKEDLSKGFTECFRVLKDEGILIFKWNECDILLKEVLKLTDQKPLFGHPSGKAQKTHWLCFMKLPSNDR